MEALGIILPIIIYLLTIVLLVMLIILGTKLMKTVDRINSFIDYIEEKIESLNNILTFATDTADKLSSFGGRFVDKFITTANKIIGIGSSDEYDDY